MIMETNGNISVLPNSNATNVIRSDLKIDKEDDKLPVVLISDGKISKENLQITKVDDALLKNFLATHNTNAKDVISRVSKMFNIPLFEQVGIDIAVSTKIAALHEIKNEFSQTNVGILATVEQGKGEVLDIVIPDNFETKK